LRYVSSRFADEDREQTARGYTLFDISTRYRYQLSPTIAVDAFVSIENLTSAQWREAQFYDTSRLRGEPAEGVADIHFTPGNPRSVLGGLAVRF
jgi:outer membrane receptor protein involved in Fe transport